MTFLLGYLAFVYVGCQFANDSRRRYEDRHSCSPEIALRAIRDSCASCGLLMGISVILLILLAAGFPLLPDTFSLPLPDLVICRGSFGWWLVMCLAVGSTVPFLAWHYVVEFDELVGRPGPCISEPMAICGAILSVVGFKPRLPRQTARPDRQIHDCRAPATEAVPSADPGPTAATVAHQSPTQQDEITPSFSRQEPPPAPPIPPQIPPTDASSRGRTEP